MKREPGGVGDVEVRHAIALVEDVRLENGRDGRQSVRRWAGEGVKARKYRSAWSSWRVAVGAAAW